MPRANVGTTQIVLKEYFQSGQTWEAWLQAAEDPSQAEKLRQGLAAVCVPPDLELFLKGLKRPVHVLAIAEDWCGDVVRHAPVPVKMAQVSARLQVRFVRRLPQLIDRYLTNGAEAIPKFIVMNHQFVEIGNWGPRPEALKVLMARAKAAGNPSAAYPGISAFYDADQHQTTLRELCALVDIASTEKI